MDAINEKKVKVFHLGSTEANDDWIRSVRLLEKGDKKSLVELERRIKAKMEYLNEEE